MRSILFSSIICLSFLSSAAVPPSGSATVMPSLRQKLMEKAEKSKKNNFQTSLIFDLPVTYNKRVSMWTQYFQNSGRTWFREWLERATKYMPFIQKELKAAGLPQDLAYMVMIESGFSADATSTAAAVGPWQFIAPTAQRYGLKINFWIDERRDLKKSTQAAIRYLKDLHKEFGSWYLVAASYNMGENGLRRKIQKYNTKDFWILSHKGALPKETMDYVPKILAAMMITKAPLLYGFNDMARFDVLDYEVVSSPPGLTLDSLADYLGVTRKSLKDLNSELILGYVPSHVDAHLIRIPRGASYMASTFLEKMSTR